MPSFDFGDSPSTHNSVPSVVPALGFPSVAIDGGIPPVAILSANLQAPGFPVAEVPLQDSVPTPRQPLSILSIEAGTRSAKHVRGEDCEHCKSRIQHDGLVKGFTTITVAAMFIAATQAQIMSTTVGVAPEDETIAIRAINTFYLGGLILDILAASLAFLTARWMERLTEAEKDFLEHEFSSRNQILMREKQGHDLEAQSKRDFGGREPFESGELIYYTWLSLSLFVPMPLLVLGIICMLAGVYTYVWTQHSAIVGALVTLAGAGTVPFVVGAFYIGRKEKRRRKIIRRLSEMQGDW